MRRIGRQQEHRSFSDHDIAEYWFEWLARVRTTVGVVDDLQNHRASVLVEPFWGSVYMVVSPGIGAAHYLHQRQLESTSGLSVRLDKFLPRLGCDHDKRTMTVTSPSYTQ